MTDTDLQFFYSLTDLDIQFHFTDNRKPLYLSSVILSLENLEGFDSDSRITAVMNLRDKRGMRFLVAPFDDGLMLLGPFILDEDPYPIIRPGKQSGQSIPTRTPEKIKTYSQLLSLKINPGKDFENTEYEELEIRDSVIQSSMHIDIDEVENRYRNERYIRFLIASGKRDEMREIFNRELTSMDFQSRMPSNPLRLSKNMSIVLNSIGRLSAEKGGLPAFLLHSISEKYAIKIEKQTTVDGIEHLQREMLLNYCDAVYNYAIENHSIYIVKACQFILMNLHAKLKLIDIAENCGINPSYLSRRFNQETGQTIFSYIREKRMMEAQWMLSQTEESITDIALTLGFEDINYFSKVFRKEKGVSPSKYRQKMGNDDFDGLP